MEGKGTSAWAALACSDAKTRLACCPSTSSLPESRTAIGVLKLRHPLATPNVVDLCEARLRRQARRSSRDAARSLVGDAVRSSATHPYVAYPW
jgi:hypothetical protein